MKIHSFIFNGRRMPVIGILFLLPLLIAWEKFLHSNPLYWHFLHCWHVLLSIPFFFKWKSVGLWNRFDYAKSYEKLKIKHNLHKWSFSWSSFNGNKDIASSKWVNFASKRKRKKKKKNESNIIIVSFYRHTNNRPGVQLWEYSSVLVILASPHQRCNVIRLREEKK